MDYKIGEILKEAEIGIAGERISFVHCGHAVDVADSLAEHVAGQEPHIVVNKWGREQVKRLGSVLVNPDILGCIRCSHDIGMINRDGLLQGLRGIVR